MQPGLRAQQRRGILALRLPSSIARLPSLYYTILYYIILYYIILYYIGCPPYIILYYIILYYIGCPPYIILYYIILYYIVLYTLGEGDGPAAPSSSLRRILYIYIISPTPLYGSLATIPPPRDGAAV